MPRPGSDEYAKYYDNYVSKVPEASLLAAFEADYEPTLAFLRSITEPQSLVLHSPYTWTFREVLGHILDGERVFTFRALWFARGDERPLYGFDEMDFDKHAQYKRIAFADLVDEFSHLRRSTIAFFKSLPAEAWQRRGVASDCPVSVNALAYMTLGHGRHHFAIMKKRLAGAGAAA
jgi:hypothetical protein